MRIGILTLPLHTNYGGILQAYALQTVLERMGHNVVVLDTSKHNTLAQWELPFAYGKRVIKNVIGKKCEVFRERHFAHDYPILSINIRPFVNNYIHLLVVNNLSELKDDDFDAIVVGSDQVWRRQYFRRLKDAYLCFATSWNIKRIAYAASFGAEQWEYSQKQTEQCKNLLRKFDAVSVRESSGVKLCREHLGIKALHVLDPTMLLTTDDYKQLIDSANVTKNEGKLLCYVLDETREKSALIEKVFRTTGKQPFRTNSLVEDRNAPLSERTQPPVEQWLQGFIDAEFVVTDSFHGTVFSILFNKPLVVVANESRGNARFVSLLHIFGLEQCLYTENWTLDDMFSINWDSVNDRLNEWRKLSFDFIGAALS